MTLKIVAGILMYHEIINIFLWLRLKTQQLLNTTVFSNHLHEGVPGTTDLVLLELNKLPKLHNKVFNYCTDPAILCRIYGNLANSKDIFSQWIFLTLLTQNVHFIGTYRQQVLNPKKQGKLEFWPTFSLISSLFLN